MSKVSEGACVRIGRSAKKLSNFTYCHALSFLGDRLISYLIPSWISVGRKEKILRRQHMSIKKKEVTARHEGRISLFFCSYKSFLSLSSCRVFYFTDEPCSAVTTCHKIKLRTLMKKSITVGKFMLSARLPLSSETVHTHGLLRQTVPFVLTK